MTTIDEMNAEIEAYKEALEIIEERTGDKSDNSIIVLIIKEEITYLQNTIFFQQIKLPAENSKPEKEYEPDDL